MSRLTYQINADQELEFLQFRESDDNVKLDDKAVLSILPFSIIPGIVSAVPGLMILSCWHMADLNRKIRENPDVYFNHFCPFCNSSLKNHLI